LVFTGGDYFYALRGRNDTAFWQYSDSNNNWSNMADTPDRVNWGGELAWTWNDYLFAFRGDYTTDVWRYQLSRDLWIPVADAPAGVEAGGSMTYVNPDTIYALRGNDTGDFWRFDITPPEFDLTSTAGGFTINARIQISGSTVTYLLWDID
jgi:hypothetical protein